MDLMPLLKVSVVVFMAGNLLDMGLGLNPRDAFRGLESPRFVVFTLLWGFVLGPAVAWAITRVLPLEDSWAMGLLLMGLTPCAPFVPAMVRRAKGDLGLTAAFMILTAVGTVVLMPFAVPLLVKGLTVTAWAIARPLLLLVLIPLAVGMAVLAASPKVAASVQPIVKKATGVATIATVVLLVLVYGKTMTLVSGSLALTAQIIFFAALAFLPFLLGVGMPYGEKIVLSVGMATRNLGAALAPLFSAPDADQRAVAMIVFGLPFAVGFSLAAGKVFGPRASSRTS
jgi:bile acid:Na+ symporter, BASS family